MAELRRDIGALIAFIDSRRATPHAPGRRANDCVGYALDAVEAQTGVAVAADLDWTSKADMLRLIERFGSIEHAFDAYFERIAPAQAHRGDIGLAPPAVPIGGGAVPASDDPFALHPVIVEGQTLVGPGVRGNNRLPRSAIVAAWSAVRIKAVAGAEQAEPTDE